VDLDPALTAESAEYARRRRHLLEKIPLRACALGGSSSALLAPTGACGGVGGEGLGHRPLGDDGDRPRPASRRSPMVFSRRSSRNSRAVRAAACRQQGASGTAIVDELGPEHMRTGALIVYTSADSVFQIARTKTSCRFPSCIATARSPISCWEGLGVGRVIGGRLSARRGISPARRTATIRAGRRRARRCSIG